MRRIHAWTPIIPSVVGILRTRIPLYVEQVSAFLFDFDGTLADTSGAIVKSLVRVMDEFGIRGYGRPELLATIGIPLLEVARRFCPGRPEEFRQRYREIHKEDHRAGARPYPGVIAALERLREAGFGLGIVTSKSRGMLEMGIDQFGFRGLFDVTIAAEDVIRHKPEPDAVLKGVELLGVPAQAAMMVGDTVHDVVAGKRAGSWTGAALWGIGKRQDLLAVHPDLAVESIGDLVREFCTEEGGVVIPGRPR